MYRRIITVEPGHVLALLLIIIGAAMLIFGSTEGKRMKDPIPLDSLTIDALEKGIYVEGAVDRLLCAPGKGYESDRLFPVAATNAVSGTTYFAVPMGERQYIILKTPKSLRDIFNADGQGDIAGYELFGIVWDNIPLIPDTDAMAQGMGLENVGQLEDRVSDTYYIMPVSKALPSYIMEAGACLILVGMIVIWAKRKDFVTYIEK